MSTPANDLLARANNALIHYPRFNELHRSIRMCQELSVLAGEPQCMVLEGVTGAGKSTLVRAYSASFPRRETGEGTIIPVLYVETPSPATVKGLAARMLEAMGDPAAQRGTLWSMNSRLVHYGGQCQVQLVALDDFHHLIDRETNRVLAEVSDWLKVLIKEMNKPFLVVGIEGKVDLILQNNKQLSRLFAVRETLEPFQWEPSDKETIREFALFVKCAEEGLGMSLADEFKREEWLQRLYMATNGIVGNVMNLIRFAALLAQQEQATLLTREIMGRAFDTRLRKHVPRSANPFTDVPQPEAVLPAAPADPANSTNNRSRRRKEVEESPAEVLRAS